MYTVFADEESRKTKNVEKASRNKCVIAERSGRDAGL
jgi:hypothetical protein